MLSRAFLPSFLPSKVSFTKHRSRKVFTTSRARFARSVSKHSGVLAFASQSDERILWCVPDHRLFNARCNHRPPIANAHLPQCPRLFMKIIVGDPTLITDNVNTSRVPCILYNCSATMQFDAISRWTVLDEKRKKNTTRSRILG